MPSSYNWPELKNEYFRYYQEAIESKTYKLPYYEIQHWDKVLNPVQLRIYQDIKSIGIPLYPIFPITPGHFLSFANPFNRVAIEIVYKNTDRNILHRKLELIKPQLWTIYKIESNKAYYTFDEYCTFKKIDFEDLDESERLQFLEKNKESNDSCLLRYMKAIHFGKKFQLI